ncbi:MAG: hypothetical protein CM1200mP14_18420 [Gammaproteobacteria bacterium]|nr:MAG: hypothetical protein CM1200mP14_18420 [Gammaproteobacteria bacterium]
MIDPLAIRTQTSGEQERGFPASEVERATGSENSEWQPTGTPV